MGRPVGSKNKDKVWADALRVAVMREGNDGKARIFALAEQCVTAALGGDMQAIKEIGDRLDGKPAQAIETTGEMIHRYVARVPGKADTAETWQHEHSPTIQ